GEQHDVEPPTSDRGFGRGRVGEVDAQHLVQPLAGAGGGLRGALDPGDAIAEAADRAAQLPAAATHIEDRRRSRALAAKLGHDRDHRVIDVVEFIVAGGEVEHRGGFYRARAAARPRRTASSMLMYSN